MSDQMRQKLAGMIAANGPLPVDEFMRVVLLDPTCGYYTTGVPFGKDGDFITAPEISQMFGELLGLWAVDCWHRLGSPSEVALVELGPGRGTLMSDALRAIKSVPSFGEAATLHMVEASEQLRAQQQANLPVAPIFHDTIDTLPDDQPLIILANEFFDALPVRQFQRSAAGWSERCVDLDRSPLPAGNTRIEGPRFRFVTKPTPLKNPRAVLGGHISGARLGAIVEYSPACDSIVATLGRRINRQSGALLAIDYGYAQSGIGDTLQALRAHKPVSVLLNPGSADLTTHVNFERLAAFGASNGAIPFPLTTQGAFLQALGIENRAAQLMKSASPDQSSLIVSQFRRLTEPDQMGDLFKVFGLASANIGSLAGFAMPEEG